MKIILELKLDEKELKEIIKEIEKEDIKEALKEQLFEICEDWVIRGQEPDFIFREE